jgi:Rieske Fe-S protein
MTQAVMQPKIVLSRRKALTLGVICSCSSGAAQAQTSAPARNLRPVPGDQLVRSEGLSGAGEPLRPDDVVQDAPQFLAWPKDPASGTVRDGSRLNQVLLLRLDPEGLEPESRAHSVSGVLAYSATCTHAQCPVSQWRSEVGVLHCPCHGSEFDPRAGGRVVNGPALRRLPPLPLRLSADGTLEIAQPFVGKVGGQVA